MTPKIWKVRTWCLLGLMLSFYATHVKVKTEENPDYKAYCDIAPKVSCTNVFKSRFGRGFGLTQYIFGDESLWNPSNGFAGVLFYSLILLSTILPFYCLSCLRLFLSTLTNLLSFYLAYLLYFVLKEFCLVCFGIYIVNTYLLIESWRVHKQLFRPKPHRV